MATSSTKLKVWFENQSTDLDFDPTMKASRVQLLAMSTLCSGKTPALDPRDYQLVTPGNDGLDPGKTLSVCGIAAGADLLLVKKYKQGRSDIRWALGLGVYAAVILVGSLGLLTLLWPWTSADLTPSTTRSVTLWVLSWKVGTYAVGAEVLLLYVVLLSGIIGACVWSLYALSIHLSAREDFNRAWAAWYIVRPFIGAGLALVLYAVVRAGLFSAGTGVSNTSVLGVAALSFLVGLFAENAVHKLHEIADTVFGNPPSGQPAGQASTPSGSPPAAPPAGPTSP